MSEHRRKRRGNEIWKEGQRKRIGGEKEGWEKEKQEKNKKKRNWIEHFYLKCSGEKGKCTQMKSTMYQ